MASQSLKKQIIKKLDNTRDTSILNIIDKLLDKASLDPVLKDKLTKRTLKAEEDIEAVGIYSSRVAKKKIKNYKLT